MSRRRLLLESLEDRRVLAAWQNPGDAIDVNHDLQRTPSDLLAVLGDLILNGERELPASMDESGAQYLDVDGDSQASIHDLRMVLAALIVPGAEGHPAGTEGEHQGSSPNGPPEANDHTWTVDLGPELDTGCSFAGDVGGSLVFEVPVDRVISADQLQKMLANGLISSTAHLRMPAFDVDSDATSAPEWDRVLFNGHDLGLLTGTSDVWLQNDFDVPIEWVNFPDTEGGTADNTIEVVIDTHPDSSGSSWCTSIDWAALTVDEIAAPVLLVHGILSDNTGWAAPWQAGLDTLGIPNEAINLGSNQGLLVLDSIGQNAGDIAAQVADMTARLGVDQINIVAHSKGGIDSRHFIEGSDQVARLIQLGTPNAGSPLADVVQLGLLGLTGVFGSAVVNAFAGPGGVQLMTGYMGIYNLVHGHNPNTEYISLAGDYTFGGLAGTIADLALEGLYGGPSDTIVPVSSVHALSYAEHQTLATSGAAQDAMHTGMVGSSLIFNLLSDRAVAPLPNPGASGEGIGQRTVATTAGLVAQGLTNDSTLVLDGTGPFEISLLSFGDDLGLTLTSPAGGAQITPALAATDPNIEYFDSLDLGGVRIKTYQLSGAQAVPGPWTLHVSGAGIANLFAPYVALGVVDHSEITLDAATGAPQYQVGDNVVVEARLENAGQPLLGATVTAGVLAPSGDFQAIALADDGMGADATAGDGIYTGVFASAESGDYQIGVNAAGLSPAFQRSAIVLAPVASGQADFATGFTEQVFDDNGNGLHDRLVVSGDLTVDATADYFLRAVLADAVGNVIDEASLRLTLTAGTHVIDFTFDGSTIFQHGVDGPYQLQLVRVAEEQQIAVLPVVSLDDTYATSSYLAAEFEHDAVVATGGGVDMGVDTDADGDFDELQIGVDLDVLTAGTYQWSARLEAPNGQGVGFASGQASLIAGLNTLQLVFEGNPIGTSGLDGPYQVRDLLVYGPASVLIGMAYTTQFYMSGQFDGGQLPATEAAGFFSAPWTPRTYDPVTWTVPIEGLGAGAATIDWGDGAVTPAEVDPATGAVRGEHIYMAGGEYHPLLTLVDGQGTRQFSGTVLIAGLALDGGTLQVYGTPWPDAVSVQVVLGTLYVSVSFLTPPHHFASWPAAQIEELQVWTFDGGDVLAVGPSVGARVLAWGGPGGDVLHGGASDDILQGEGGNDVLVGNGGNDLLIGGDGIDQLWGFAGNDTLQGDAGTDFLFGGTGDDHLSGGDGDDYLYGEQGIDLLLGGAGRDVLLGGSGDDELRGGLDDDYLYGESGADLLDGEEGNDLLSGGPGVDQFFNGEWNYL